MKVYKYSASGLYLGEGEADASLLEEGKFLMPPNSTTVPPPECGHGEWPIFRSGQWDIHRVDLDGYLDEDDFNRVDLQAGDRIAVEEVAVIDHEYEEERRIARENLSIIVQIMEIEITEQHRAIRDFALTGDRSRLEDIESRISQLRSQLT